RTDRSSGAAVAFALLGSRHELCAIIAEKRDSMLTRKKSMAQVVADALRAQGAGFVISKAAEMLGIKLRRIFRRMGLVRQGPPYRSVGELLIDHAVNCFEVDDHNGREAIDIVERLKPDILVLANTRIIKGPLLAAAPRGCINLHLGKLPEYRGMASCFWEIYAGEKAGGVTVHRVDAGLDTGDIVARETVAITPEDDEDTLYEKKLRIGAQLICAALDLIESGGESPLRQDPGRARTYSLPSGAQRRELAQRRQERSS
ncbi:MAG TPA: formyl transferase, partial [bacterium]|nr:formyl transferase [bacterium]